MKATENRPGTKIRRIQPKPATEQSSVKTPKLDPGDMVEFGTTIELDAGNGTKIWMRGAAQGHVRPEENGSMAWSRVANFVQTQLDKQAAEYTS